MLKHVEQNMHEMMKDKKKKVELEERLRLSIANGCDVDPDSITLDLVYNKMANSFDIVVKANEAR